MDSLRIVEFYGLITDFRLQIIVYQFWSFMSARLKTFRQLVSRRIVFSQVVKSFYYASQSSKNYKSSSCIEPFWILVFRLLSTR